MELIKLNFDGSLTFYREREKAFESRGGNYIRLFIRINGDDGRCAKGNSIRDSAFDYTLKAAFNNSDLEIDGRLIFSINIFPSSWLPIQSVCPSRNCFNGCVNGKWLTIQR